MNMVNLDENLLTMSRIIKRASGAIMINILKTNMAINIMRHTVATNVFCKIVEDDNNAIS